MLENAEQRLTTETEPRAGIATGEIEIHYQPTVSIRTGRVVGSKRSPGGTSNPWT